MIGYHSRTRVKWAELVAAVAAMWIAVGCSATGGPDSTVLYGAPEVRGTADALSGSIPIGTTLITTANVNLRDGPGTSYEVQIVMPKGSELTTIDQQLPKNAFYKVEYQGYSGWAHSSYLKEKSTGGGTGGTGSGSASRTAALKRAKAGVGFSYWWGHGKWRPEGVSNSNAGECDGSCPSCSHSGSYGADCSGFAAKVWQVPSSNNDLTSDSHPYGTSAFYNGSSLWNEVARDELQPADALVHNDGSSGHIVIYESGDGWGQMWVYECKGCAAGCVHDLRSFGSSYIGIRKAKWDDASEPSKSKSDDPSSGGSDGQGGHSSGEGSDGQGGHSAGGGSQGDGQGGSGSDGPTCGDGTCDSSETCDSCPDDCGACAQSCGDGVCDSNEGCDTCELDCGACAAACGDGTCDASEMCDTCPDDCGVCPATCGDGSCDASETCQDCPQDCGSCTGGCSHSECETGAALDPSCGECVASVCAQDSVCCGSEWDSYCVDDVTSYCTNACY